MSRTIRMDPVTVTAVRDRLTFQIPSSWSGDQYMAWKEKNKVELNKFRDLWKKDQN